MTINHYESCSSAYFCQLWEGCALKLAEGKLMTYQAQITTAAFQKLYRKKLIKLTATHPGQETGKCAKTVPKIAPFENANFFFFPFPYFPPLCSHPDTHSCIAHPGSTCPPTIMANPPIRVTVLCTEPLFPHWNPSQRSTSDLFKEPPLCELDLSFVTVWPSLCSC